jgi:predicted RNA-binding Zn-ribbon protein involved in translation (DUF1610 family)
MVNHIFTCDSCAISITDTDTKHVHICPECGCEMRWNLDRVNIASGDYMRTKWSDSLAISPDQISEHKRLFPDVKVDAQGRIGFDSFKQHDTYLNKTGFVKHPQKVKREGVKIA